MPRGIPKENKTATTVKEAKRKYVKKSEKQELPVNQEGVKVLSNKQELINYFKKNHIQFEDYDGHFALPYMVDLSLLIDMSYSGAQAINARMDLTEGVPYLAVYY